MALGMGEADLLETFILGTAANATLILLECYPHLNNIS